MQKDAVSRQSANGTGQMLNEVWFKSNFEVHLFAKVIKKYISWHYSVVHVEFRSVCTHI